MFLVLCVHIGLFFALLKTLSQLTRNADIWNFRFAIILLYLLSGGIPSFMVNNYLDCLQSWFTFFATYASLRALLEYGYKKWLWYVAMAWAICLGYMTKGPVALFPLVQPLIWGYILRQIKTALLYSLFVVVLAILPILLLIWLNPEAREFMYIYHKLQVSSALMSNIDPNFPQPDGRYVNTNGYVERIFMLLKLLFNQQLLPLILLAFFYFRHKLRKRKNIFVFGDLIYKKTLLFFMVSAFCASFPIMLSPTIGNNYLMPAHTLYILVFSMLLLPFVRKLQIPKPNFWRVFSVGITVILFVICVVRFGVASRHSELIQLAQQIAQVVPRYSRVYYEEEQMFKLSPFYVDKKLWSYDAVFNRYSGSVLVRLSEVKYATPKYLLLHSSRITHYADLLKAYSPIATYQHAFKLYLIKH